VRGVLNIDWGAVKRAPHVRGAVGHYDVLRAQGAREHDAREAAALYLRRKCAGSLGANGAAVALADALARRAESHPQPGDA
jgi:hypothetical protein